MVCPRGSGEGTPIPRARMADQRSTRNRIPRQGELLRKPLPRTPVNKGRIGTEIRSLGARPLSLPSGWF
jgi:hypothetical protein